MGFHVSLGECKEPNMHSPVVMNLRALCKAKTIVTKKHIDTTHSSLTSEPGNPESPVAPG